MSANWRLMVSGAGPLAAEFRRIADEQPSRCVYLGFVSVGEMYAALAQADAAINTPERVANPEGLFPFKMLEYIASGVHVISTPLPALGGPPMDWFQRWNGEPSEMGRLLQQAESDYQRETLFRETAIRWVVNNFRVIGVASKLDELLKAAVRYGAK